MIQYQNQRSLDLVLREVSFMGKDYGYARISTKRQSIDRQIRNILAAYPDAMIFQEVFTGTKFYGRKEFDKLLRVVKSGDRIIFDSVSRMSRNADEGIALYFELYDKGISLVFLKEPHINTDVYKEALQHQVPLTGTDEDILINAINSPISSTENVLRVAYPFER